MCYVTVQTCIIIAIISLLMLILRLISCKLISSLSRFHNNLTPDNGASLHMPNIPNVNVETSRTLVQKSAPNPPESSPTSSPTSPFINIFIGGNVNEHTEQKYILNLQIVFKGFLICVCVGGVFMLGSLGYNFWLLKNNKAPTFPTVWLAQFIAKHIPELQPTQEGLEINQEEIIKKLIDIESTQKKPSDEESLKDVFDSAI